MLKNVLTCCLFLLLTPAFCQTVQTPEQFLGYPLGSRFTLSQTAHAYFRYIASALPARVKYQTYGTSYENRTLGVCIVAAEANMSRLEDIRNSNLIRAGQKTGTPLPDQPAILFLSYNIHGNEAVSTETAMQVLYDLATAKDAGIQSYLRNTVVVIDPCLNPDGHDRYVNFYTQVAGKQPDASPNAREHHEPWPGGRFNHYVFDPNRDWAWQTQRETQARINNYYAWMPQVHADFHEMGSNSPYFFAPAAKPYHEVITNWQRELQNAIGASNKKYFDERNWLYFTRETFDLFYPSYGDTYPTYNGAVGLTYEQGGSGFAGLALARSSFGDTLTLAERISHHYGTSIGTLAALSGNAEKAVKNFEKYFTDARNTPSGEHKTYVFKSKNKESNIRNLAEFLDKQRIAYGFASEKKSLNGYNFQTFKTENFAVENGDLVVSAYQSQANLVKVLFEPKAVLEDSATYDITAWSVPLAYGLETFGLKEKLALKTTDKSEFTVVSPSLSKPYAYLARWNSLQSLQFLSSLLKRKMIVRCAEKGFEADGQKYEPGTLVITRSGNEKAGTGFDSFIQSEATRLKMPLTTLAGGGVTEGSDLGSNSMRIVKAPRVGIVSGSGISPTGFGDVWHYFEEQIGYPATVIDGNYLRNVDFSDFDVLVLPSGNYGNLLPESRLEALVQWVNGGGKLIALEGAVSFLAGKPGFDLKKKDDKKDDPKAESYEFLKEYGKRDREALSEDIPGAIYRVDLDNSHPLAFGYGKNFMLLKGTPTAYQFLRSSGWNVGILKTNNYVTGFTGSKTKAKLQNCVVFGVQDAGNGNVVYFTDSPIFRGFWYNGKLLFGNAVFLVGN